MTRREEREQVFCLIYELPFSNEGPEAVIEAAREERALEPTEYIISCVKNIAERLPEIDALIERFSSGWKTSRIAKVSLAILRLAVYECEYSDIPESAAINEAVELAKKYDGDAAPAFINGILGGIVRREKQGQ